MHSSAIVHKITYFSPNPAIFYNNINIFKKGTFLFIHLKLFQEIRLISALPEPLPYGSLCS